MEVPIRCPLDEEFGYKARRELALCLDPIAPMGNDWRLLMDEMGFAYSYKHYLEQEKSPTIKLLEAWTQRFGDRATVSLLKEYISKLEPQRMDAVDVVKKYMKQSEVKRNHSVDYNDETFCSSTSPSDTTGRFATQCTVRTTNHSRSATRYSTSSSASISSSVSSNLEEGIVSSSPVTSNLVHEAPVNSFTSSGIPNGFETTLQEPSSYMYPPSPIHSPRRASNSCVTNRSSSLPTEDSLLMDRQSLQAPMHTISTSYATDPSSLSASDGLLNDRQSLHTPVRSVASGEKLVLTSVDNGAEPLGISVSPSLSPRHRSTHSLSPRPSLSRCSSSSPTTLRHIDPIEETIAFQHDSSEDDVTTTCAQEEIQPENYDIYLSASQDEEDQRFAELLHQKLKRQKFTVFFSGHHNIIGRPLTDDVVQMIRDKCTKTLIILSESYNRDEKCTYEARMAHMKSMDARNHVLVPVMFKKCKAPDFISHLYYLDYERYKNRPAEDVQEYFWNRLYRSLRYAPSNDTVSNKKKQSGYSKKLTTVITTRPKFPFFTK